MSSTIRMSIIIPHLNDGDGLRRCLATLTTQEAEGIGFEIIVVDNGSKRLPEDICAAFPGTRLEHEPVPGPGPARNRGASVAKGEILAFIDADCVAAPGWLRAITNFLDSHPQVDFLGGDIRILPERAGRLTAVEAYESIFSYRAQLYVERHGFAATGNMAVRAKVFEEVGPFGGIGTMEDTEWGQRASAKGYRVAYLPQALVLTEPSRSFTDLTRRWDRHVAHEFRELGHHRGDLLAWIAKGLALAASPVGEIPRIARTDRVAGPRARALAFACLTRIRLYRARRMLGLVMRDNTATLVGTWNREEY